VAPGKAGVFALRGATRQAWRSCSPRARELRSRHIGTALQSHLSAQELTLSLSIRTAADAWVITPSRSHPARKLDDERTTFEVAPVVLGELARRAHLEA